MSSITREFKESPFYQGTDEIIAYKVTVPTSWGTSDFSSLSSKIYSVVGETYTDTTSTNLSGSTTASGQVITTPLVQTLTDGTKYRLEVKWVSSEGNTLEAFAIIYGQR